MADFSLYSTDKKEYSWNTSYTTVPQSNSVKKEEAVPMIFKPQEGQKKETPKTKETSIFESSNQKYNSLGYKVSNQEDGLDKEVPGMLIVRPDAKSRQDHLDLSLSKFTTDEEQAAEFKRLAGKSKTKNDVDLLAGTLKTVRNGVVVDASKSIVNINGSEEFRTYAGTKVANEIPNIYLEKRYDVLKVVFATNNIKVQMAAAPKVVSLPAKDQVKGTQVVVDTKNEDVINELAKVAYKADKEAEAGVWNALFDTGFEKVQTSLAKTEGKFESENQIPFYNKLMTSKYQKVIEEAARNIYTMGKENQVEAFKITANTNNEAAINAASAQYAKYDDSAKAEIKSTILSTNYTSVHETLAKAEIEEQTQTAAREESSKSSTNETSSEAKINAVKELIKENNANSIELRESIKNLSDSEKIALIRQCPNNQNVLWAIFDTNPSLEVLAEIGKVMDIRELKQSRMAKLQFGFFDSNTQVAMIENSNCQELKSMNRNELNIGAARTKYDELIKKGDKGYNAIG